MFFVNVCRRLDAPRQFHLVGPDVHAGLFPEQRHAASDLHERRDFVVQVNDLFGLDEVRDETVVVAAPHVEPGAGPPAAQSRYDGDPGLLAARVDGFDLHAAADDFHQPQGRTDPEVNEIHVQVAVPKEPFVGHAVVPLSLGAQGQVEADVLRRVPREVKTATVQQFTHLRRAVVALLFAQRDERRLRDFEYLRVGYLADGLAPGDQHQEQRQLVVDVHVEDAETPVRVHQLDALPFERVELAAGGRAQGVVLEQQHVVLVPVLQHDAVTVAGRLFVRPEDLADDGRRLFGGHGARPRKRSGLWSSLAHTHIFLAVLSILNRTMDRKNKRKKKRKMKNENKQAIHTRYGDGE